MSESTIIAWTDHTFNPWMGCEKVSDGCKNCYAATLTKNRMGLDLWGGKAPRQVTKAPWKNVIKWNADAPNNVGVLGAGMPDLTFCASLCDVFEDHPTANATRPALWDVIRRCRNIHFQVLTKRPERIVANLPEDWGDGWPNVWLGTSVEDMRVAGRVDHLRDIPAIVRFISYEPALGSLADLNLTGIDWVIFGGESGAGFRAADLDWSREMRDRCEALDIAYFHKQSSHFFTERGTTLDGETVRNYPTPRTLAVA